MTIGIYALYWEASSMVYIGQGQDIKERFRDHCTKLLKQNHFNYKVQDTFNKIGLPTLIVLEESTLSQLDELEINWIKEFDSINTGLNITNGGTCGRGVHCASSKYSRIKVLQVFRLLTRNRYISQQEISTQLNVNISLVRQVRGGRIHLWLKDEFPNLYTKMLNKRGSNYSNSKSLQTLPSIKNTTLIHTSGLVVKILNINEFCRVYNTYSQHICNVINRKRKTHKGWKLLE